MKKLVKTQDLNCLFLLLLSFQVCFIISNVFYSFSAWVGLPLSKHLFLFPSLFPLIIYCLFCFPALMFPATGYLQEKVALEVCSDNHAESQRLDRDKDDPAPIAVSVHFSGPG